MIKLDRLVTILGSHGARLATTADPRDAELRSVAMHDPASAAPTVGDAFLAVGVPSLPHAVDLALAARATVLLARPGENGDRNADTNTASDTPSDDRNVDREPDARHLDATRSQGLHILLLDPHTSWSQVAGVVYGLVLEGRETESGRGPGDLFALADTLAAGVGGPVTIEDPLSRVLAYSSRQQDADPARLDTILGRRVPDELRTAFERRGVFAHLATSDQPLFLPPEPEHGLGGRTIIAVRAGKELLGSIWATGDTPLDPGRLGVLTDGAHTVALHLLRTRVSADLERQVESELVIQLLEGTPDAPATLARLGLPPQPLRVIAMQAHTHGEQGAANLLAFERATTGFGWSRPGRTTLHGNTVYTVLPCDDPAPAHRWLDDLARALPGHVTLTAGIGGPATPPEVPASRREADESHAVHFTRSDSSPVTYDTAWGEILIQRLRTVAAAGRVPHRGPLADLARHDRAHSTRYLSTLRAWLESHGDLTAAAARLEVHPNTVRYRLRKMHDVAELDIDDPRTRLAMLIALTVDNEPAPRR